MKSNIIIGVILLVLVAIIIVGLLYFPKKQYKPDVKYPVSQIKSNHFGIRGYSEKFNELGFFATNIQGWNWSAIEPRAPVNGKSTYIENLDGNTKLKSILNSKTKVFFDIGPHNDWAFERDENLTINHPGKDPKVYTEKALMRIKPEYLDDWKNFVAYLVKKYSISYLLVNSEAENVWGSADGYAEALCAAYESAKQANPDIKVVAGGFNLGGLVNVSDSVIKKYFLMSQEELNKLPLATERRAVQKMEVTLGTLAKGGNCFDILAIHHDHGVTYDTDQNIFDWYKQKMAAAGYDKPIWMDNMNNGYYPEFNSTSTTDIALSNGLKNNNPDAIAMNNKELPMWMVKKAVGAFSAGVETVFLDTSADIDYFMPFWKYVGLLEIKDGAPKAAYYTAKILISKISQYTKVEKLAGNNIGDHTYKFTLADNKIVVVAWSDAGDKTVDLSSIFNGNVKITHIVTELDAQKNPIYIKDEIIPSKSILLTKTPVFIERN